MSQEVNIWLIFILLFLATTLPRSTFIVLRGKVKLPDPVQRALRYAPAAALAAIIVPDVVMTQNHINLFNPKLAAAIAAIAAAKWLKNPWLPFIAGMGVLLSLKNI